MGMAVIAMRMIVIMMMPIIMRMAMMLMRGLLRYKRRGISMAMQRRPRQTVLHTKRFIAA